MVEMTRGRGLRRWCRGAAGWRRALGGLGLVAVLLTADAGLAPAQQRLPAEGFADLVAKVAPAVVNVSTTHAAESQAQMPAMPQVPPGSPFEEFFKDFFDHEKGQQPPSRSFSLGSGFVVDPRGYVVTNNHVISDADEIAVVFSDDTQYKAKIVGRDQKTDLALLKIDGAKPFPYVQWADSDKVRVGDLMLAIGNPFGLGSTVTQGIVSARGRDIRSGPYDDFIQVDAAINRGNSGGPSFTMDGKVFGVNTAIFSPSGGNVGIGFAIPSNLAKPVIESLLKSGKVVRGWLGVRIQSVTPEIAESLNLPDSDGALVASVTRAGPAAEASIQPGDVIVEFDGKKIDHMRNLPRMVAETPVGRPVDVVIWRKGGQKDVKVTLGELPDDEQMADLGGQPQAPTTADTAKVPDLGVTVSAITDALRAQYKLADSAKGVVITEIETGGPAADESLRPGDVVVEVGQEAVAAPADLLARVETDKKEGKKAALLLIDRQGDLRFVALRLR
jgi:serine protease Do